MNTRCFIKHVASSILLITAGVLFRCEATELQVSVDDETYRVKVLCEQKTLLTSPPEGLWSIATDWQEDWPAEWKHAHPDTMERVGEWIILRGGLHVAGGAWVVSDAYRPKGNVVQCIRRFTWKGPKVAERCTLSARFWTPGRGAGVLMPGILYHGNPSGARSGRVPVYEGRPGEEAIFEEHRFPMPFVSFESQNGDSLWGAALHTDPSPVPWANLRDQWWSLGVVARENQTEFVLLSGPCASNGRRSVIKAVQPGFVHYGDAYLNVPPGAIIEKTFYLEAFQVPEQGAGFRRPTRTSLRLFAPYSLDGLPTFREIIRAKYRFSKTRWHEADSAAGFRKYPDRNVFVMGWCGQAAALGYALTVLSDGLSDPRTTEMAQKSLDFLSGAKFYEGGFHTWYNCDQGKWSHHEPLSQGQAMLNFARAIRVGKKIGMKTSVWETFLRKACDFHSGRILANDWRPVSTDQAFMIAPLCEAYRLLSVAEFRRAAEKAGNVYASRHLAMREPYWGGTLDASCEDKEGAYAALQGFLSLYDLTGNSKYLKWAEHACDAVLTYVVIWDIDLPPGRLRDHRFRTRGWTVVSPQNQHIDVFGVLIAPAVYRMGQILQRDDLQRLALLMYRSCGQLIDPYGSQGEQPQHTSYAQRGRVKDILALRGGYVEDWTVFWITAHFLNAAAQFHELGVPIWD